MSRMKANNRVTTILDNTVDYLAYFSGALIIFIMIIVSAEVIGRKLLGTTIVWALEVSEHSILFVTFMSAAWVLKRDAHVKVDILLTRLSTIKQRLLNMATSILGAILCFSMSYWAALKSWDLFQRNVRFLDFIVPAPVAPFTAIICVGYLLLAVMFLSRAYQYWRSRGEPLKEERAIETWV